MKSDGVLKWLLHENQLSCLVGLHEGNEVSVQWMCKAFWQHMPQTVGKSQGLPQDGAPVMGPFIPPMSDTSGIFLKAVISCSQQEAFVDSGAAGNFMADLAVALKLPLHSLECPISVLAIDGWSLDFGVVTHQTSLVTLHIDQHMEQIQW